MNGAFRSLRPPKFCAAILKVSYQPSALTIRTMSTSTNGAAAPKKSAAPEKKQVKILMIHGS